MSSGHQSAPPERSAAEHAAHSAFLDKLISAPAFEKAVAGYRNEDDAHDYPFLAGSNNEGDTVGFDRRFVQAIKAGKVKYDGRSYDPRPFIKVHEAIEGAAIRLLHTNYDTDNARGLPGGHIIATWAERRAVEHAGLDWQKYQDSLKPWIRTDEGEKVKNPPPDLLKVPYIGTPQAGEVGAPQKLSHQAVGYGPGHLNGDHCAVCRHYQAPHCEIVSDPISPRGWCRRFERRT